MGTVTSMQSLCTHITFLLCWVSAQDVNAIITSTTPSTPSSSTEPISILPVTHNLINSNANLNTTNTSTIYDGKFLSAQQSAALSQIELDWIQRREVVKDVFEMSIGGMIKAVDEVQKRGDSMMSGIRKQKEMLEILKEEIKEKKEKLASIDRQIQNLEEKKVNAKEGVENAELDVNRINKLRVRIKDVVKKMEKSKKESEDTLRMMETQIEELVVEMEERKPKLARLGLDMIPLKRNVETTEAELASLSSKLGERSAEVNQVTGQITVSNTKLSHLKDRITSLSNLPIPATNKVEEDMLSSTPPIVPALVMSTALNMITGATIISKFLVSLSSSNARVDMVDVPVNKPLNDKYIS